MPVKEGYATLGDRLVKAYGTDEAERKKKLEEAKKKLKKRRSIEGLKERLSK